MKQMSEQIGELQNQNIELSNTIQQNGTMITTLTSENASLQASIDAMVKLIRLIFCLALLISFVTQSAKLKAQEALVSKYEKSSHHGTQTIDSLQQSIATMSNEQHEEMQQLFEQIEALTKNQYALEIAHQEQVQSLHSSISCLEVELEQKKHIMESLVSTQHIEADNPTHSGSHIDTDAADCAKNILSSSNIHGIVDTSIITSSSGVVSQHGTDITNIISDVCMYCKEEAFGFMVKCQKCKSQYHAGCVRSKRQKKHRAGHVFICPMCVSSQAKESI